jgi:hypothetical protein
MLFLQPAGLKALRADIRDVLSDNLPVAYRGYPTNFTAPNPEDHGTQIMRPVASGPVNHRVETYTLKGFFAAYLRVDISRTLSVADWLTLPHQKLRSIVAGRVFRDDLGLEKVRARFTWYPHDVWLYVLASVWQRIGQEEHLMGRAGFVGDEVGSAIIGSRLARDVMRLAFLMEKQYPPYAKWFGTAFLRLKSGPLLAPVIGSVLRAPTWQERQRALCDVYRSVVQIHNSLGITETLSPEPERFFGRPFRVIQGEKIANAILAQIKDPDVVPLTRRSVIGSIDLVSDNTDVLEDPSLRPAIRRLYADSV